MTKYKKIVVVGVDGAGKTTFINRLAEEITYDVVKGSSFTMSEGKTNEELFEEFNKLCEMENVIFDRFTYCNYIYASMFDDYASLTESQIKKIEHKIKNDTLLIFITANTNTIESRFKTRGEDYVDISQVDEIKTKYFNILDDTVLTRLNFNTTYIGTEEMVNCVLPFIK